VRAAHPGKALRFFFEDEARVGQQGTLTRVWAPTGSRPAAVRQTEYEWVYLWAAVEPLTGTSVAMVGPTVDTDMMNTFLAGLSGTLAPGEHAVLFLDGAGWHGSNALRVPANVTLATLPPYSPELNPVERLWRHLRGRYLSNRVYRDYGELLAEAVAAYDRLDAETLKSVCGCPWLERAIQA
jgi:hypothetical protein